MSKRSRLDKWLDAFHAFAVGLERATRRKKEWSRERIASVVGVGASILSVLATVFPQIRGLTAAASVAGVLQQAEPLKTLTGPAPQNNEDEDKDEDDEDE